MFGEGRPSLFYFYTMIINAENSQVEVIGDIQEFKTGIDPKNLEFITTLLSSNLYSHPEQSFIREIISNAWDSQVEAGTTDIPVLVKINYDDKSITIRDFGTGLSPERFKTIFCNIGSSTKRDSNDYIGGFGIGRFASLACSNTVHITSYYEGKSYYYIMCKSGNTITTNLVYTLDTEEKNGVEISIKNLSGIHYYIDALDYVVFFPNVYLDITGNKYYTNSDFNEIKIKHFTKFSSCSKYIPHKILLGNVLYPCDRTVLNTHNEKFIHRIQYTGIVIKFNIGELDITPNRESIIYTEETKKIINTRIEEARNELYNNISTLLIKDYTDIKEYSKCFSHNLFYNTIENIINTDSTGRAFSFTLDEVSNNITYKGKDLSKYKKILRNILSAKFINHRNFITTDKIYNTDKLPWHIKYNNISFDSAKVLVIPATNRLTSTLKTYLRQEYPDYNIVTDFTFDDFSHYIVDTLKSYFDSIKFDNDDKNFIIKEFHDSIIEKVVKFDFTTDSKFLKYKEEISKNKLPTQKIQDVILYVWTSTEYSNCSLKHSKYFKTLEAAIVYIKSQKSGVIISNISPDDYTFANVINTRGHLYITANKQTVTELQKIKLNNIIPMVEFLKDKTIIKLHNYICNPNFVYLQENILNTIPEFSKKPIVEMQNLYSKYYKSGCFFSYVKSLKNIKSDSYIDSVCSKAKFYYEKYMEAQDIVTDGNFRNSELLVEAVIKKKRLYRMPYLSYKRINKNKLLNVLCSR